ncbi:MAG TPA: sigma factor, partial [Miltoncostaeaceae bacterium]|nr:sigma factor [Miltoncostaeaceae bacterium]
DAEDLVQETYARVLARPRLLRNEDDLGYLLRALRNTFVSARRARARRPARCTRPPRAWRPTSAT